jgi:hypothetical protein
MAGFPVKPPVGSRLDPAHSLWSKCVRYVPFLEGSGPPLDLVSGTRMTTSGRPKWEGSPVGASVGFVSTSSQYVDFGNVPEMSGTGKCTIITLVRRRATAQSFTFGRGTTSATAFQLGYLSSNDAIARVGTGAANAEGQVDLAGAEWHHLALVFDGGGADNTARLKLYVDGVLQTLTYTGTVGATTPTSASTFRIGRNDDSGLHHNGVVAFVGMWAGRALTATEVRAHASDPWMGLAWYAEEPPAEVGGEVPAVVSATASNRIPAADAVRVDPGSPMSIDWTPTNLLNPVMSVVNKVNGIVVPDTETSIGGGAIRSVSYPALRAGQVNVFESTATTLDDNPNTSTWSSTPRSALWVPGLSDHLVARAPEAPALSDYLVAGAGATEAIAAYAVPSTGVIAGTDAIAEYYVQERADGLLAGTTNLTDYLVTEFASVLVLPSGANIGEGYRNPLPTGAAINATERAAMPAGAAIGATEHRPVITTGAEVGLEERVVALLMGALIGTAYRNPLPTGAVADAFHANVAPLVLEYVVRSLAQQSVEEEE